MTFQLNWLSQESDVWNVSNSSEIGMSGCVCVCVLWNRGKG